MHKKPNKNKLYFYSSLHTVFMSHQIVQYDHELYCTFDDNTLIKGTCNSTSLARVDIRQNSKMQNTKKKLGTRKQDRHCYGPSAVCVVCVCVRSPPSPGSTPIAPEMLTVAVSSIHCGLLILFSLF